MTSSKAVTQYLQRYAEPVAAPLYGLMQRCEFHWQQAIVIPAFREGDAFVRNLLDLQLPATTLFILVLNGPRDANANDIATTRQAIECLELQHLRRHQVANGFLTLFEQDDRGLLCVDLFRPPADWPINWGVGYARKLGCDIALWLHQQEHLLSPWVRSSDADVCWPADYFQPLSAPATFSAILFPFEHGQVLADDAGQQQEACAVYDAWLRYYVAGLAWSGSPWAFHTIGSTFGFHLEHYAIQRGFPKREAGEDFYLLNKLAKGGLIQILDRPRLRLSQRISNRTPFGTGYAIGKISQSGTPTDWPFYHPAIFAQLKIWQRWINELNTPPTTAQLPDSLYSAPVGEVLAQMGVAAILQHCQRQCAHAAACQSQLWQWFDAARTRKCVHLLRDHFFGTWNCAQLLDEINQSTVPFIKADHLLTDAFSLSRLLQEKEAASHFLGLDHGSVHR